MRLTTRMTSAGVSCLMLVTLTATLPAMAHAEVPRGATGGTGTSEFCTNLSSKDSTSGADLTALEAKLTTAQTNRKTTFTNNWAKWSQTLTTDQTNWNADRQADFAKLMAKATTPAEQAAVTTYENAIESAINTRETANASARTAYQNAILALLNNQASTVNGQVQTLGSAISSAVSAAQASCTADSSNGVSIRTTFIAALNTAHMAFQSDRNGDGTLKTQIQALAQTLKNTTSDNDIAFQTAANTATTALKSAFGVS